ncbi:MAG: Tll0287-like domain-containing protein [Burkholderiales bacterium]
MKVMKWTGSTAAVLALLAGCTGEKAQEGVSHKAMANALHAVMEADRTVYTRLIVNRLQNEEKIIKASEHWKDEKALVLPAQMFRFGAEMVAEKNVGFSYSLLSLWPVNKQNAPKTPIEEEGLKAVAAKPEEPFYKEETLGGKKYFTAVYPDKAVAKACITCHNEHKDSPRSDFKLGDVMGGVIVRIPMN